MTSVRSNNESGGKPGFKPNSLAIESMLYDPLHYMVFCMLYVICYSASCEDEHGVILKSYNTVAFICSHYKYHKLINDVGFN